MIDELPSELREIEGALAARPAPPLPDGLRRRVLESIRRERQDSFAIFRGAHRRWAIAAAVAAGMLLWLNLALIGSPTLDLRWHGSSIDEAQIRRIRQWLPELDEREARRLALLQAAGAAVPDASFAIRGRAVLPGRGLVD
jgi:hypothetical protein